VPAPGSPRRQFARASRERAREADAEQGVHHQAPGPARRNLVDEAHAGGAGPFEGAAGFERQCLLAGQVHGLDRHPAARQVGGQLQPVAAIVAGAGQHQRGAGRSSTQQLEREVRCGAAGALHQRAGRQAALRGVFDGADLGTAVEQGIHEELRDWYVGMHFRQNRGAVRGRDYNKASFFLW
jgi:hypothetical protein